MRVFIEMNIEKSISLVMVTYNSFPFFKDSIEYLNKFIYDIDLEIIIVDNNSKDVDTHDYLDELKLLNNKSIKVIKLTKNTGYSVAMNVGMNYAKYEFVLCFNNDIYVDENSNEAFVSMYNLLNENIEIGAISPLFVKEDKTSDLNYVVKANPISAVAGRLTRIFSNRSKNDEANALKPNSKGCATVDILSGQFFIMRKSVYFNIVGGFDTRYFLYSSDWDISRTLKFHGLKSVIYTKATLTHGVGKSTSRARFLATFDIYKSFAQYLLKWEIFPFIRFLLYRVLFTLPALAEITLRSFKKNKNVSD